MGPEHDGGARCPERAGSADPGPRPSGQLRGRPLPLELAALPWTGAEVLRLGRSRLGPACPLGLSRIPDGAAGRARSAPGQASPNSRPRHRDGRGGHRAGRSLPGRRGRWDRRFWGDGRAGRRQGRRQGGGPEQPSAFPCGRHRELRGGRGIRPDRYAQHAAVLRQGGGPPQARRLRRQRLLIRCSDPVLHPTRVAGARLRAAGPAHDRRRAGWPGDLLPRQAGLASVTVLAAPCEVARLRFIQRAKLLGLTLEEIRELVGLAARCNEGEIDPRLEEVLAAKLQETERKIEELSAFRKNLLYYRRRAEDLRDAMPVESTCEDVSFCGCLDAVIKGVRSCEG